MKRGNKRGQFYLLAAIVIIVLISGFAAISNYTKKKSSVKLYDLREELHIESGQVLEYGVTYEENINDLVENFTGFYQEYAGENKNLYFIFGNYAQVWMISYIEIISTVSLDVGSARRSDFPVEELVGQPEELDVIKEGGVHKVVVDVGGIDYEFELKPGENFFFVISQEVEGERHVVIS